MCCCVVSRLPGSLTIVTTWPVMEMPSSSILGATLTSTSSWPASVGGPPTPTRSIDDRLPSGIHAKSRTVRRDARSDLIGRLADAFSPEIAALGASGPSTSILARATIGGVFELLYGPLARRDVDRLAALRDEIGDLPLVPLAAR